VAVAIGRMEEKYEAQKASCEVNHKHVDFLFFMGADFEVLQDLKLKE
jgi:hypothetical protein